MKKSGVHLHLERELSTLNFQHSLKALDLVVDEMSAEKGFVRHNGIPYYEHLIAVAQLLSNFGFKDDNILAIALLHDILEDVEGYTQKLLEREFNAEIAEAVFLVTKKPNIDYKNNSEEMKNYLRLISDNRIASLVKTADRIHNFFTLQYSSLKHRQNQVDNTLIYFIPFFKTCRHKYVRDEHFYYHAKTFIEPLAFEIKRYLNDV